MIRRLVPPPPGWMERPVPGEDEFMRRHVGRIRAFSRRVWSPHRLGKDNADVEQDIAMAVLAAARRHVWEYGELPTDPFASVVARRRAGRDIRASMVRHRLDAAAETVRSNPDDGTPRYLVDEVPDDGPPPDAAADAAAMADVAEGLVYAVRRNLPPASFAILYLRYVEELSPTEIAAVTGIGTDERAGHRAAKRTDLAKALAYEFLRSLGIGSTAQAAGVTIKDFDYDEIDGQ